MTEHSIEELKRQLQVSKSALEQAQQNFNAASARLHKAMCDDSGLIGKVVETYSGARMQISNIEFIGEKPWRVKGFLLKKDGNLGGSERTIYLSEKANIELRRVYDHATHR